jgi:hypothetical protein
MARPGLRYRSAAVFKRGSVPGLPGCRAGCADSKALLVPPVVGTFSAWFGRCRPGWGKWLPLGEEILIYG